MPNTPLVDGQPTPANSYGVTTGNGGATDRVSGTSGNDQLQGFAAFNQYNGGEGNDTFIVRGDKVTSSGAYIGQSNNFSDLYVYVTDFQGAGGYSATNNDFLRLVGFGAGSTLTLVSSHANGTVNSPTSVLYMYAVTDGVTGNVVNVGVNSVNGQALLTSEYKFY